MSDCIRATYKIHGHVQGVGFRYFVQRNATEMALKGYVKNLYDGTVECVVESDLQTIEHFKSILKRGSSRSHVTNIEMALSECKNNHNSFEII
jgi:acylphosphatase